MLKAKREELAAKLNLLDSQHKQAEGIAKRVAARSLTAYSRSCSLSCSPFPSPSLSRSLSLSLWIGTLVAPGLQAR